MIVLRTLAIALRRMLADSESRGLLGLSLLLTGGGAVFYRLVEKLSWLDSFYLTVMTLTTVGYGDISPATRAGKLFTIFYVLVGIGLLAALITKLASTMIEVRSDMATTRGRGSIMNDEQT